MIFSGRTEKTNFYQHLLTKTSKIRQKIPEKVVKITTKIKRMWMPAIGIKSIDVKKMKFVPLNPEFFAEKFELNENFGFD